MSRGHGSLLTAMEFAGEEDAIPIMRGVLVARLGAPVPPTSASSFGSTCRTMVAIGAW
ncbi:MAG: hypothetical protein LZF62_480313 [Nitrospira sp.]|nr:MAG: hypothetical protein LZF62_480313 [Nitrospira sp.]